MSEPDLSTAGRSSPPRRLLFVKIKATGVETGAFPIEIGWCDVHGRGDSHLIWPTLSWKTGSLGALEEDRQAASEIARHASAALDPGRVLALSDSVPEDQLWLDRLLAVGGLSGTVRLEPFLHNIIGAGASRLVKDGLPSWPWVDLLRHVANSVEQAVVAPAPHHVLAKAQRNAAIWRDAMRRIDAGRAAWKVKLGSNKLKRANR